jgi:hypothetical protein
MDGDTRVFRRTSPTGLSVSQPLGTPGHFGDLARRLRWREQSSSDADAEWLARVPVSERGPRWFGALATAGLLAGALLVLVGWLWLD